MAAYNVLEQIANIGASGADKARISVRHGLERKPPENGLWERRNRPCGAWRQAYVEPGIGPDRARAKRPVPGERISEELVPRIAERARRTILSGEGHGR